MNPKDLVRRGYDKISHVYRGDAVDPTNPTHAPYIEWITALMPLIPEQAAILDMGCGNGIPATRLLADAGYKVTGVDSSPVQIARARVAVPEATFLQADMTALDFAPQTFAAVIMLYSIIHVPLAEQPALFAQIYGWLQEGGYLLVTVGATAWTGTEPDWLNVPDAAMYWSHADSATYQAWLAELGFTEAAPESPTPGGCGMNGA